MPAPFKISHDTPRKESYVDRFGLWLIMGLLFYGAIGIGLAGYGFMFGNVDIALIGTLMAISEIILWFCFRTKLLGE